MLAATSMVEAHCIAQALAPWRSLCSLAVIGEDVLLVLGQNMPDSWGNAVIKPYLTKVAITRTCLFLDHMAFLQRSTSKFIICWYTWTQGTCCPAGPTVVLSASSSTAAVAALLPGHQVVGFRVLVLCV